LLFAVCCLSQAHLVQHCSDWNAIAVAIAREISQILDISRAVCKNKLPLVYLYACAIYLLFMITINRNWLISLVGTLSALTHVNNGSSLAFQIIESQIRVTREKQPAQPQKVKREY